MGGQRCGVIDGMGGGGGGGMKAPPGSPAGDRSVTSGGERETERAREKRKLERRREKQH